MFAAVKMDDIVGNNTKNNNNHNSSRVLNIAASWPAIVGDVINEQALERAQILPQLLHEASEEAQMLNEQQQNEQQNWGGGEGNIDEANEEQLQSMLENYRKHVIKQKQQQQQQGRKGGGGAGRSSSHLQRRINAPQPTPMSHSHPCLFSSSGQQHNDGNIDGQHQKATGRFMTDGQTQNATFFLSDHRELNNHQQMVYSECNGNNDGSTAMSELMQLRAQNEKLRKKCERLEELEKAYKKIERDYDQVSEHHERREELLKVAIQKLEQQLKMASVENEQLRAQNARLGSIFDSGDGEQQMQIHFLLNELVPKNEELLMIQERQRIEMEAQSATLEDQRTHIDVLEKAMANAQERLAAKERSAVDAVAVVDKCTNLQRMLQEALEDKQRQKEEHGRQVAQLEMELTQLRLQFAKDNNSSAIGSIGRKSGGAMTTNAESTDELVKLRKTMGQKDDRISQLESGLLEMQRRYNEELKQKDHAGLASSRSGRMNELDAIRLELEKSEKERRIQELLDEKCRIQMQWNEERRSLDHRVRLLEKDLRYFMGSQNSLASSPGGGYGPFAHGGGMLLPYGGGDLLNGSPFASMRGQNSYLRHRSTAELPTSARIAALYEQRGGEELDVMARIAELGRKISERRATLREREKGTDGAITVQRPSELTLVEQQQSDQPGGLASQHPSLPSRSSSVDRRHPSTDLSPSSEDHQQSQSPNAPPLPPPNGTTPQRQPTQSAASSASSSTKKRYYVGSGNNNHNSTMSAYLEQLPEPTRRRLTGERMGAGGFHLLGGLGAGSPEIEAEMIKEGEGPPGFGGGGKSHLNRLGPNRRGEGGCRRLIRDHSIDARRESQQQPQQPQILTGPPNYHEAQQQQQRQQALRREQLGPPPPLPTSQPMMLSELPPPAYHQQPQQPQPFQLRQMHKMSSIEEPLLEPPPAPPSHAAPTQPNTGQPIGGGRTVVEVKGIEEGNSDTLNSHRQLVYRRSSLGNTNAIAK